MIVDTPLTAAGFAIFTYLLTFIIALLVTGIIYIIFRIVRRSNREEKETKQT